MMKSPHHPNWSKFECKAGYYHAFLVAYCLRLAQASGAQGNNTDANARTQWSWDFESFAKESFHIATRGYTWLHMVTRDTSTRYLLNLVLFVDAIPVKDLRSNCWPSVQSAESPEALMEKGSTKQPTKEIHGKSRFLQTKQEAKKSGLFFWWSLFFWECDVSMWHTVIRL